MPINRMKPNDWISPKAFGAIALAATLGLFTTGAAEAQVGDTVLFATGSASLGIDSSVNSGNIIVNDAGGTLDLDEKASTPSGYAMKADSIDIEKDATINSAAFCNTLSDVNSGTSCSALSLPAIAVLPQFVSQAPAAGSSNFTVGEGKSKTISPGDYDVVKVRKDGTLKMNPGVYQGNRIWNCLDVRV